MESSSKVNLTYYPAIELASQPLSSDEDLGVAAIIDNLHDDIIDCYNGEVFANYKRGWIQSVFAYFRSKQIDLPRTPKPNWENVSAAIIDKLVSNSYNFQRDGISAGRGSVNRRSSSSGSPSSTNDTVSSDTSSVKKVKLTDQDKDNIKKKYAGLDKAKMWRLSTGTLVEEQMKKQAMSQDHEHLSHSLIMDIRDKCWLDYFSAEEIDEIKRHRAVQLPMLPSSITALIDELTVTPRDKLYEKVNETIHAANTDQKWIQDTYNNCFRLVQSGFFDLRDITEQGIGKRMWSCVDTCFDFSTIQCISGEKCSKASADAANLNRSPSDFSRQQCGRKMDYIFKTKSGNAEIGCGECALVGGINTTKEFQDAGFKMPKVMRDMLYKIVSKSPGLVHKLCISGFYVGDNVLTLLLLDSPAGYVSRYDAFNSVEYPIMESKIRSLMGDLLTMILSARIIMEDCRDVVVNDESRPSLGRYRPVVMEPCFVPAGINYKKRKQ